jgi:hypothetical protein
MQFSEILRALSQTVEVTMVAKNAREVLKKENELLDDLAQRASVFAQKAVGVEADVINAWTREFRGRRESNDELIGKDDSAFDQELKEEIKLLESLRNSITGGSDVAQYWRGDLGEDIALSKKLL